MTVTCDETTVTPATSGEDISVVTLVVREDGPRVIRVQDIDF